MFKVRSSDRDSGSLVFHRKSDLNDTDFPGVYLEIVKHPTKKGRFLIQSVLNNQWWTRNYGADVKFVPIERSDINFDIIIPAEDLLCDLFQTIESVWDWGNPGNYLEAEMQTSSTQSSIGGIVNQLCEFYINAKSPERGIYNASGAQAHSFNFRIHYRGNGHYSRKEWVFYSQTWKDLCLQKKELKYRFRQGREAIDLFKILESSWSTVGGQPLLCNDEIYAELSEVLQKCALSALSPTRVLIDFGLGQTKPDDIKATRIETGLKQTTTYEIAQADIDTLGNRITNELSKSFVDAQSMVAKLAMPGYVDPRLHSDQLRAVDTHMVTDLGYVSAMGTGQGKTIPTLVGMSQTLDKSNYTPWRSLVICEASVRDQWEREAAEWLDPSIRVLVLRTKRDAPTILKALQDPTPALIITSYALTQEVLDARTKLGKILNTPFANVIADEAKALRGSRGKQNQALWMIRSQSHRAAVLCATPVLKEHRDLAKLMAWARNEPAHSAKAINLIFKDKTNKAGMQEWYDWWGPTLIRSTPKSAQRLGTVPEPKITVLELAPTDLELAVTESLQTRVRSSLETIIEAYERRGHSLSPEEKKKMRGTQLSIHELAKQAASDIRLVAQSETTITQILKAGGHLTVPNDFVSAKMAFTVQAVQDLVAANHQIVIFSEYPKVVTWLSEQLTKANITNGVYTGTNQTKRAAALEAFQQGQTPVLVCSKVAERGLNLQNANVLIHYDLGFTADLLFQRSGRIIRIGSPHKEAHLLFPVTLGTYDEKTLAVTTARAGLTGVTVADSVDEFAASERGKILEGLAPHAKTLRLNEGQNKMLALSKALVS